MKKIFFIAICILGFMHCSKGQETTKATIDIDEIEIGVKSTKLSEKGDTVTVELFLQSYLKQPRELNINTFATGLVNPSGKVMFYDSMLIGKVRVLLADRQNYIHYLLTRDEAVTFTIKTPNWQKRWGKPQSIRITLEDHLEVGKFLQVDIPINN